MSRRASQVLEATASSGASVAGPVLGAVVSSVQDVRASQPSVSRMGAIGCLLIGLSGTTPLVKGSPVGAKSNHAGGRTIPNNHDTTECIRRAETGVNRV